MAKIKDLEDRGMSGFEPEWDEYSGRTYRWRIKALTGSKATKTWHIGFHFGSDGGCENFRSAVSRQEWREEISSRLTSQTTSVIVEIVYRDYERGNPTNRSSVLKGTRYPVAIRNVRGGASRPVIQWSQGDFYQNEEKRLPPSGDQILSAEIGSGVRWLVFVWDDGWRFVAGFADQDAKNALVAWLGRRGRETYTVERKR